MNHKGTKITKKTERSFVFLVSFVVRSKSANGVVENCRHELRNQ